MSPESRFTEHSTERMFSLEQGNDGCKYESKLNYFHNFQEQSIRQGLGIRRRIRSHSSQERD